MTDIEEMWYHSHINQAAKHWRENMASEIDVAANRDGSTGRPIRLTPSAFQNAIRVARAVAFIGVYKLTGFYGLIPFGTLLIHRYGYWTGLGIINVLAMAITTVALMANHAFPAKPTKVGSGSKALASLKGIAPIQWSMGFVDRHQVARDFLLGVWFGPPLTQVVYRGLKLSSRRMVAMSAITSVGFCLVWYSLYGGLGTLALKMISTSLP